MYFNVCEKSSSDKYYVVLQRKNSMLLFPAKICTKNHEVVSEKNNRSQHEEISTAVTIGGRVKIPRPGS